MSFNKIRAQSWSFWKTRHKALCLGVDTKFTWYYPSTDISRLYLTLKWSEIQCESTDDAVMMEGWSCRHQTDLRSHPCWRMLSRLALWAALCTAASVLDRASAWQCSSDAAICFLSSASKALLESGSSTSFTSSLSSWAHSSTSWLLLTVKEVLDSFPELRSVANKKTNSQLHHQLFGSTRACTQML